MSDCSIALSRQLCNDHSSDEKLAQVQQKRVELTKSCMLKPNFEALVHMLRPPGSNRFLGFTDLDINTCEFFRFAMCWFIPFTENCYDLLCLQNIAKCQCKIEPRPDEQIPCHSLYSRGIIYGLHRGSFAVRDLGVISSLGMICAFANYHAIETVGSE